jgi:thymidylate synthase (FAD)
MKVELIRITPDAEMAIAEDASECYDSDTSPEACERRIKHLMKVEHLATLRFAYATIRVSGISRVCSHQMVRIAHAGILQRSQRYVNQSAVEIIIPPSVQKLMDSDIPLVKEPIERLMSLSQNIYDALLEHGIKKEDARYFLLEGTETSMRLCLNLQAWKDVLANRTSLKAQWEIRGVADEIQRQLTEECPNIFGELNDE